MLAVTRDDPPPVAETCAPRMGHRSSQSEVSVDQRNARNQRRNEDSGTATIQALDRTRPHNQYT